MSKKYISGTEMAIIPASVEETKSTKLALRFIGEALASIVPFEIYSDAYDSLREDVFMPLEPFFCHDDFEGQHPLVCPGYLQLFVGPYKFFGWFRAWVRKQGIDPDSLVVPNRYPFTLGGCESEPK